MPASFEIRLTQNPRGFVNPLKFILQMARVILLVAISVPFVGSMASLAGGSEGTIEVDTNHMQATLADGEGNLKLRLNYDQRCILDRVIVRGRQVAAESGVRSGVRIAGQWYTTETLASGPKVAAGKDRLVVSDIAFGAPGFEIHETWEFTVGSNAILWRIARQYPSAATIEDSGFPEWDFESLSTWTGGILDNGGAVWNKYLGTLNATYGAHAGEVTFWNRNEPGCLRITPGLPVGQFGSVRFSHQKKNVFSFNYVVSGSELKPQHDLRRYLPNRQDLWAPFQVNAGRVSVDLTLRVLNYADAYDRGTFAGLDGNSIRDLLNTAGRYGVIDQHLVGGNGWRSGFICLHEQWFPEIGLALNDPDYDANFAATLDFERDHAILPDGRVLGRWSYDAGDAMPGTYNEFGYYEAQWGYLMDSQPDYVMDVAEQFDLSGDRKWLAGQKQACEKALDYLMHREVAGTGLVAMMTDSHTQQRGSDWIDIIWASYENALVNAELYGALGMWAKAEDTLGDPQHAGIYREFAARLKHSFNQTLADGGFWDPTNQWYAYWRDKDGSVHGNNLVVPVNFSAIGYGLCDDPARIKAVLDRTEAEMQKENLFSWPISFFPYQPDEGARSNFPFPKYENGVIFMSWDELGIRAYAAYDRALALKYVRNALARYQADGLSFQHYERKTQRGGGDDILSGNCMPIVGLYRDIYGVQPKPDRLYLAPHLTDELNGTKLRYRLRNRVYQIDLSTRECTVASDQFSVSSPAPFGINATPDGFDYFSNAESDPALSVSVRHGDRLTVSIESWPDQSDALRRWTESAPVAKVKTKHTVAHLKPESVYVVSFNGKTEKELRADETGQIHFTNSNITSDPQTIEVVGKVQ